MFHLFFSSPQVKRSLIISNKLGIYELPHELPNDLLTEDLRKLEKFRIIQNFMELCSSAQSSSQKEHFVNTSERLL